MSSPQPQTSANVEVALHVEEAADEDATVFITFKGTDLTVHNLAAEGRSELWHQAGEVISISRQELFDDIAWRIAASTLRSDLAGKRSLSDEQARAVLPYLCFLAEQLSPDWEDQETRDVFLRFDGDVSIHAVADLRAYVKTLSA
ncbi:MAG TPA: hypothetical protein VGM81_22340 [Burkholderiaceae bacterium]|jgi:hypothetical protein